jgi:hypothetical protein
VKWAVCIITTNAASPNTHSMRASTESSARRTTAGFAGCCADDPI